MDELEKSLIQTYGTSIIPKADVAKIVDKACRDGLIDRSDAPELDSMDASELFEQISHTRRKFLLNKGFDFDLDNEIYGNNDLKLTYDSEIMDKVLKAFFEYEKIRTVETRKKKSFLFYLTFPALAIALYFSYTPSPY